MSGVNTQPTSMLDKVEMLRNLDAAAVLTCYCIIDAPVGLSKRIVRHDPGIKCAKKITGCTHAYASFRAVSMMLFC